MIALAARALDRAGLPAADALVVSARDGALRRAANACRAHRKVAVLTGPGAGPAELARELFPQTPRTFVVCEDLDGPAERIERVRPAEATTRPWNDPQVVLVLDPFGRFDAPTWLAGAHGPSAWALPADAFARPAAPPEVRALALARLGPRVGDLVWDVGADAGPMAVECARLGAAAVAVAADRAARDAIRADVAAHRVKVAVARGAPPAVLAPLPEPDAVYLTGTPDLAAHCAPHALRAAVAITTPDGTEAVRDALAAAGFTTGSVVLGGLTLVHATRDTALPERPAPTTRRPVETLGGLR
ncbi:Precorrin-6Y C(5,15)-methyltransferase [decarboxylating] [Actinomadura rubteroloni]|uniref:Precorrin-6Y C(5,15)-methyltransferase [decarboxylating] n=1 Tax=Actinomadura rubteroloni TaxID=1926885 RepID=A0A2P4URN8_9ACTN|nr:hypothetical protein [Actinomadura rubteroloni]POM27712.1 Precorrin-6Y C(5,15)-methyltransferase [decarboxylating] [Actinomadura rubteroloni]